MAQGGASALEDAAILARCLECVDDIKEAFHRYEATRHERTARLQLTSRENTWGKHKGDPGWVYDFDAWQTPIAPARALAWEQAHLLPAFG